MDFGTRRYQIEAKTVEENVWKTIPTCLGITDDNVSCLAMQHMSKGIMARIDM